MYKLQFIIDQTHLTYVFKQIQIQPKRGQVRNHRAHSKKKIPQK